MMHLTFDDLRKIRWLAIYRASVARQAEEKNLDPIMSDKKSWLEVFSRAREIANMDKEWRDGE